VVFAAVIVTNNNNNDNNNQICIGPIAQVYRMTSEALIIV